MDIDASIADVTDSAVSVDQLQKRYGRVLALEDVSFDVKQGELFALLGPNGAGKTTLIHVLCTIHAPDSGIAKIHGIDVMKRPRVARELLGVVFQEHSLDGRLTVSENLDFHGRIYGVPGRLRKQRIDTLLDLVELSDWRDELVRKLSGGMKRRLEIARALVHDARVLILDEPTVGLDAQTRERIWTYLHRLRRERHLTMIVTTHYIDEVEGCDRVCIIDQGKVLALDAPERLKDEHGVIVVRIDPRDSESTEMISADLGTKVVQSAGWLVVEVTTDEEAERIVEEYRDRARAITLQRPSLETVFLSLTGRDIRDGVAGARDRMRTFAKHGGEHTK